jgi:hypothetical protein
MLPLKNKAQLDELHANNVKESLHLEYKAAPSVDKTSERKLEMARDVSAFANSDGGQIIYGMTENTDHEPPGHDQGVDGSVFTPQWFEQVLQQHVTPTIPNLVIKHIPLAKPMVAVVIDIPSSSGDPHQVSDGKYYRRHNFNRLPMEHYEIRDAMRRSVDPDLYLEFDLLIGEAAYKNVQFTEYRDRSDPVQIAATIKNRSNQPAMYTFISVFLDKRLPIVDYGIFKPHPERQFGVNDVRNQLMLKLGPPSNFPIFKEMGYMIDPFAFTITARLLGHKFGIGYELRAPGCFKTAHGHLEFGPSGQMHLLMPKS